MTSLAVRSCRGVTVTARRPDGAAPAIPYATSSEPDRTPRAQTTALVGVTSPVAIRSGSAPSAAAASAATVRTKRKVAAGRRLARALGQMGERLVLELVERLSEGGGEVGAAIRAPGE